MSEEKKPYLVNWKVKHGGEVFVPSDDAEPLMLTKQEAKDLGDAVTAADDFIAPLKDELTPEQQLAEVVNTIGLLDLSDSANTIGNGSPDAGVLTEKLGFTVSAALRNQAWEVFKANQGSGNE